MRQHRLRTAFDQGDSLHQDRKEARLLYSKHSSDVVQRFWRDAFGKADTGVEFGRFAMMISGIDYVQVDL